MSLFAAEQLIIDRIQAQVTGFKSVGNPSLLAGLHDIGPLLPGCFIMPSGAEIHSQQQNRQDVAEMQDWLLVIIVAHQASNSQNGLTEDIAGTLMHGCIMALSGWYPGSPFIRGFEYVGREQPDYNLGYAEFSLNFRIKKIL
jgi:hypothetical protein